ncbi:MAG: IPT/TIG domain-containing protein [Deltaproteobacteria bacterium]|nr:IPT/TIG domain-containing protein [Deltaproteobacteria bacterium]
MTTPASPRWLSLFAGRNSGGLDPIAFARIARALPSGMAFLIAFGLALVLAGATPVRAAVPDAIPFQGLLLDPAGQPVTDNVDLDFALFGGLSGGTALWSEAHLGVAVTDGVYSVNLGSTTPIDAGVLASGPVFLEIRVEGETLVPRQQLLAVPYARVAGTVESVGGFSSLYLEQMVERFAFDGGLPPNTDPQEGTGDADGDGQPNFLDADNDNDLIPDAAEVAAGSGVNLTTPRLLTVTPGSVTSYAPNVLTLTGTNLSTLQSVQFGGETPTPTDVTPTSFKIEVTPNHLAATRVVVATLANGESGQSGPVTTTNVSPTITSVTPNGLIELQATQVVIVGTNFVPGTTVTASGIELAPSAMTTTSITVTIPPRPVGLTALSVRHPNGLVASTSLLVGTTNEEITVFMTQTLFAGGNLGGLAGADAVCQAEANAASLPGTYRAWLSDSTTSAASRVGISVGAYVMPNGVRIANSWADLTDLSLITGINVFADGTTTPNQARAWTGTRIDGTNYTTASENCSNWTSNGGTGRSGLTHQQNVWSDFAPSVPCSSIGIRLYCFER